MYKAVCVLNKILNVWIFLRGLLQWGIATAKVISCCIFLKKIVCSILLPPFRSFQSNTSQFSQSIYTKGINQFLIFLVFFSSHSRKMLCLMEIQTQGRRMEGAGQIPLSHVWLHLTKLGRLVFFCKTIYSFHKTGHKTIQKTNHYILS